MCKSVQNLPSITMASSGRRKEEEEEEEEEGRGLQIWRAASDMLNRQDVT